MHPQFRIHNRTAFDLGLLKMTKPLDYSTDVQPISLPSRGSILPDGTKGTFIGWGATQYEPYPIRPDVLQAMEATTISIQDCQVSWPKLAIDKLGNNTICVSSETNSATPFKDGCMGDSGGPFVVNNVQWGLLAYSSENCTGVFPIQFIGLSRFTSWIRNTISRDYYRKRRTTAAV
ncbi:trypsin II-P29-like [Periplaneta americana]|uniref:trypsin II-P29-like n=1 Tax=Periplaneta americana TaxID=6978 RepID=UPI0037E91C45